MKTYISILRGINVSGKNLIKINSLKEMYDGLGFLNVKTYIQSGNVVFQSVETKLNNNFFENKLKVKATTRNLRTLMELVKLGDMH